MKRYLFFAAAVLALAACSNDSETENWNGEIRLRSGLDVQQTTRAATDIQNNHFANGEKVGVYIAEHMGAPTESPTTTYANPLLYTTDGNGGMTPQTQPYYPTSGNGVNIYAIYPSGTKAGELFTVQADQSADANYKKSDLMYGKPAQNPVSRTSSPVNINFSHLLSKVTVVLESGNGNPDLNEAVVTLKDVKLSATFTATAESGSVSEATGDATDIKVMTAANNALSGSAVVVPQTLGTSFIEVKLKDGGVLTSSSLKDESDNPISDVVLTSGKEYKYTITVNLTSLEVTSSISNWSNGGENTGEATMQ